MKRIVIGWIIGVIGSIYPIVVGAMFLGSLASKEPVDVNWGLFVVCILVAWAGCMIKDTGKEHRAKRK